jgi:hypothetical protein
MDQDPHRDWTRKTMADLLQVGFKEGPGGIPFEMRKTAWKILLPLTRDPDPTSDYETSYGESMDPVTISINTTRGEAMHAVFQYALWVRRHMETLSDKEERLARGFDEMSEVRTVLGEHLDISRDPSLAIRAVYGQLFPWIELIDSAWAQQHATQIFPAGEKEIPYWKAAWKSYIIFCHPYDNVFDALRTQYEIAVDRLGKALKGEDRAADPDRKLAEHLMVFYWRGKLEIDQPEGLVARFWHRAPDPVRAAAIGFVGRNLYNEKEAVSPEIIQRLKVLWEGRLAEAREAPDAENYSGEMAEFGWWFVSGKFDDVWAITKLMESLKLTGKVEPDDLVVERLTMLAAEMPVATVECLNLIVEGDKEGWNIHSWSEHARTILATSLQSTDGTARQAAENLVHRLGAQGYFAFRDLVSEKEVS